MKQTQKCRHAKHWLQHNPEQVWHPEVLSYIHGLPPFHVPPRGFRCTASIQPLQELQPCLEDDDQEGGGSQDAPHCPQRLSPVLPGVLPSVSPEDQQLRLHSAINPGEGCCEACHSWVQLQL